MLASRLISRLIQSYWRRSRGLMLAVECCVLDGSGRVLLVVDPEGRWTWPHAGVLGGESCSQALQGLLSRLDVQSDSEPQLLHVFTPGSLGAAYTAFYVIERAKRTSDRNSDPSSGAFFQSRSLPENAASGVRERVNLIIKPRPCPDTE